MEHKEMTLKLTYKDGKKLEVPKVTAYQLDDNGLWTITYITDYGICTLALLFELLTNFEVVQ